MTRSPLCAREKRGSFALTRDTLAPYVSKVPGSRVVDGSFQQIGAAIAVGKNKPVGARHRHRVPGRSEVIGRGQARVFDKWGFNDSPVAP